MEDTAGRPSTNSTDIKFIPSNKGQPLLVFNHYIYKCNKKTPKKKYWICVVSGCSMYIHTDINNNYITGGQSEHAHPSNPEHIQVKQTREQIKQRVINEQTPIGQIYDEETSKSVMNSVAVAIFPTAHEICKLLYKY